MCIRDKDTTSSNLRPETEKRSSQPSAIISVRDTARDILSILEHRLPAVSDSSRAAGLHAKQCLMPARRLTRHTLLFQLLPNGDLYGGHLIVVVIRLNQEHGAVS